MTTITEDNELEAGDTVTFREMVGHQNKEYEATILEVKDEEAVVMPTEGNRKGEKVTMDLDEIEEYEPTVYFASLPGGWAIGQTRNQAIIRATTHFSGDRHDEPVNLWTAEVAERHWEVTGMGGVRSRVIENEEEFEVDPDKLDKVSDVMGDLEYILESMMTGDELTERYLKEIRV